MPSVGYLETRQKLVDYELLLESVRGSQIDLGLEKVLGKSFFATQLASKFRER